MDSIGKVGERLLMVAFFFLVPAILFILFNADVTDRRIAAMADEFIMDVTKDGVLTRDEYVIFADTVASLDQGFEITLEHQYYIENPYYEYTDEVVLHDYFKTRNVLNKVILPVEEVVFEPLVTEGLKLQEHTNASILASLSPGGYIPLPDEVEEPQEVVYTPMLPVQECYDGEELVTVVRVTDNGMVYYLECDAITIAGIGTAQVPLTFNGSAIPASITVTAYPRTCVCVHGHEAILTKQMIEEYKVTGTYGACASCALVPQSITANVPSLTAQLGDTWESFGLTFTVTYLDGHNDTVQFNEVGLYHDYDPNYCGVQTVALSYKGLVVNCVDITLSGKPCASCGSTCTERSFADYSRFLYCDSCLAAEPFFLGETYMQEDVAHHGVITEALDTDGVYLFNRGDYLKVTLTRLRDGIPVPFLSAERVVPVMSDGFIRTKGHIDR